MISRMINFTLNATPALLKNIGFGVALTGAQDRINEEEFSDLNIAMMTIGTVAWIAGVCLQQRQAATARDLRNSKTTKGIQQALAHSAGLAVVNSVTHLIQGQNTSNSWWNLQKGGLLTAPLGDLNAYEALGSMVPGVKWETLRFLILSAGGYFSSIGSISNLWNGEKDVLAILSAPLGYALLLAELIYSIKTKNEDPRQITIIPAQPHLNEPGMLALQLNRKIIKIYSGASFIFALHDIVAGSINGSLDKFEIANDAFAILSSLFMFSALLQLSRLAKNEPRAFDPSLLARPSTVPQTLYANSGSHLAISIDESKDNEYKLLNEESSRPAPM